MGLRDGGAERGAVRSRRGVPSSRRCAAPCRPAPLSPAPLRGRCGVPALPESPCDCLRCPALPSLLSRSNSLPVLLSPFRRRTDFSLFSARSPCRCAELPEPRSARVSLGQPGAAEPLNGTKPAAPGRGASPTEFGIAVLSAAAVAAPENPAAVRVGLPAALCTRVPRSRSVPEPRAARVCALCAARGTKAVRSCGRCALSRRSMPLARNESPSEAPRCRIERCSKGSLPEVVSRNRCGFLGLRLLESQCLCSWVGYINGIGLWGSEHRCCLTGERLLGSELLPNGAQSLLGSGTKQLDGK